MSDDFDLFLSASLAPPERPADRAFVARVDARIRLEARLGAARRSILRSLALELVALAAVAAGLCWIARAPALAAPAGAAALPLLVGAAGLFALLVLVLGAAAPRPGGARR